MASRQQPLAWTPRNFQDRPTGHTPSLLTSFIVNPPLLVKLNSLTTCSYSWRIANNYVPICALTRPSCCQHPFIVHRIPSYDTVYNKGGVSCLYLSWGPELDHGGGKQGQPSVEPAGDNHLVAGEHAGAHRHLVVQADVEVRGVNLRPRRHHHIRSLRRGPHQGVLTLNYDLP